jgi:DNA-binding response OmpR family regulator
MPETSFSNLSILLIDDEPSLNDLLEAYLQQMGVSKIVKAFNGQEAPSATSAWKCKARSRFM